MPNESVGRIKVLSGKNSKKNKSRVLGGNTIKSLKTKVPNEHAPRQNLRKRMSMLTCSFGTQE